MTAQTYAVVWEDSRYGAPAAGRLSLDGGHAMLTGMSRGEPRVVEFDATEVAGVQMVSRAARRLRQRPTVMVTLRDRGRVLISEVAGVGVAVEIADLIGSWI